GTWEPPIEGPGPIAGVRRELRRPGWGTSEDQSPLSARRGDGRPVTIPRVQNHQVAGPAAAVILGSGEEPSLPGGNDEDGARGSPGRFVDEVPSSGLHPFLILPGYPGGEESAPPSRGRIAHDEGRSTMNTTEPGGRQPRRNFLWQMTLGALGIAAYTVPGAFA